MKIHLLDLRCAFADQLYVPGVFPGADANATPAHGLSLIIPHDHGAVKVLDDAFLKVGTDKWKDKAPAIIANCMKDRKKSSWQKEEYTNDEGVVYEGFEDAFYARLRNETMPLILDGLRREVGKGAADAPFGGCFVNVVADAWLQDNSFGKALRLKLLGVQFVREGDAFTSGARASVDDFQSLAVEDQGEEEADEFA